MLGLGQQATDLARADGFPPADEVVPQAKAPIAATMPADPLDSAKRAAMRRAPLARDELLEAVLGQTEERERQEAADRADRAAAAEEAHAAKLAPYRDKSPMGMPPSWPDS
jgi:hypothetical protein